MNSQAENQSDFPQIPEIPAGSLQGTPGISILGDPLSAAFNAAAAFFNFLSTPQGQVIVEGILKFDLAFVIKMHDIFETIHKKLTK